jgi:hypothetical protein
LCPTISCPGDRQGRAERPPGSQAYRWKIDIKSYAQMEEAMNFDLDDEDPDAQEQEEV